MNVIDKKTNNTHIEFILNLFEILLNTKYIIPIVILIKIMARTFD
jgi:hypothetical protein